MAKALCIGEILIDFISLDKDSGLIHSKSFEKAPGGAPANVAVGLAKLGISAAFAGKVGADDFGEFLYKTLESHNVNPYCATALDAHTTLAFIASRSDGKKDILFYRGADTMMKPEEIPVEAIAESQVVHFGSVSLSDSPSRETIFEALKVAQQKGAVISYDPNLRLKIWSNPREARKWILKGMEFANIVKISMEEWEFVTGAAGLEEGSKKIFKNKNVGLLVVTLGADGCYYDTGSVSGYVHGFSADVIDLLGAGDSFTAALLMQLMTRDCLSRLSFLTRDDLIPVLSFANAAGALTTTKRGVIPALPTFDEVEQFIHSRIMR